MADAREPSHALLERDAELGRIAAAIDRAANGSGERSRDQANLPYRWVLPLPR